MTLLEGWTEVSDGLREPKLQDQDRVWDEIRQRLAERRRYRLPPGRFLAAFRRSCGVSQATLAGRLYIEQARISKLERRSDLRISALRAYVASLGGTLVLLARLPDRDVQLLTDRYPAAETTPQSAAHRSRRPEPRARP